MGNSNSSSSKHGSGSSGRKTSSNMIPADSAEAAAAAANLAESVNERAKKVAMEIQQTLQSSVKKLEEQDHPAAHILDSMCGQYFDEKDYKNNRSHSFYSEDISDDSRTISEDETTLDPGASIISGSVGGKLRKVKDDESTYFSQSDYESQAELQPQQQQQQQQGSLRKKNRRKQLRSDDSLEDAESEEEEDEEKAGVVTDLGADVVPLAKPLASSFAKRCYFTKAGIGKTTQHYEGLTLTGNVVLMLAAAMKLKGCPTICDEDLRRVEQTYPNQFSRLPDELLLSSGWRRISKYCNFSNKPIPDGIPFFHSKDRLHPNGGYYFLLAAAVGMVRPIDVEPLTRDTLVLLETDYPSQCDAAPPYLIEDPMQWTLVDKFCFFSGGPINTDEDVFYQADFDGNPIYMLAFLSPSLTPEELYKLESDEGPGLQSVRAVEEVESVYDLTERDFHDLKLYHLGPCRALPQYILQPQAWTKVLPPHFLTARQSALLRAQEYEIQFGTPTNHHPENHALVGQYQHEAPMAEEPMHYSPFPNGNASTFGGVSAFADTSFEGMSYGPAPVDYNLGATYQQSPMNHHHPPTPQEEMAYGQHEMKRQVQEEGAFMTSPDAPMDEAIANRVRMDPPENYPRTNGVAYSQLSGLDQSGMVSQYTTGESQFDTDAQPPQEFQQEALAPEDAAPPPDPSVMTPTPAAALEEPAVDYNSHEQQFPVYAEESKTDPGGNNPDDEYYNFAPPTTARLQVDGQASPYREVYDQPPSLAQNNAEDMHKVVAPTLSAKVPTRFFQDSPTHANTPNYLSEDQVGRSFEDVESKTGLEDAESPLRIDHLRRLGHEANNPVDSPSNYDGVSPQSQVTSSSFAESETPSEMSRSSNAMKGAQELLRRNRQRRQQRAARFRKSSPQKDAAAPHDEEAYSEGLRSPQYGDDQSYDTGSEFNSVISGSSVWTDTTGGPAGADRNSRRALILQMAKARMRNNKDKDDDDDDDENVPIDEEGPVGVANTDSKESETGPEMIDFSADLD